MTDCFKSKINKNIDKATSINDLVPFFPFIDLEATKIFFKQQINQCTTNKQKEICYSSLSIQQIFPTDIIQHIISFNNFSNAKLVNKTFNKCYKKNKEIEITQKEQLIISKIGINKNSKTWVVDRKRKILNNKEIKLKYNGPISNINDAIKNAKSGDTLLINNGRYILDKHLEFDKNIQMIGCGDNVIIACLEPDDNNVFTDNPDIIRFLTPDDPVQIRSTVHCKNIKFKYLKFHVNSSSNLFMEGCSLHFNRVAVDLYEHADLNLSNCKFFSGSLTDQIIVMSAYNNVCINNCLFTSVVTKSYDCKLSSIQCIGNGFVDYPGFPIQSTSFPVPKFNFIDNTFINRVNERWFFQNAIHKTLTNIKLNYIQHTI